MNKEKVSMNVARLKKSGAVFEVAIEPDKALAYKKGQAELHEALRDEQVYSDAKKGLVASGNELHKILGCDGLEACKRILLEGEIQLTGEIRDSMRDQRRKQLVSEIHRYGVDPRTGAPHPITRIENALDEAKVRLDENRSVQDQIKEVIKKLNPILPLKVSLKRIKIRLPTTHAQKAYGKLRSFGTVKKDAWQSDGSWLGELEIPGGIEVDLYDMLNNMTSGQAEAKVISEQ